MDPLAILRDYFARGELDRVVFSGDDILFGGDYSFPASTPTAFRSKQSGRPYPLSAAVFLAHNHRLKHTDYLQSSRLRRLPPVSLPDRKPLLDYLLGLSSLPHFDSDTSDPPPPLQTLNPKPEPPPEPGTPDLVEPSGTLLRRLERPLRSRDALLSSRGRDFLAVLSAASRRAAAAAAATAPGDSGAAAQQSNSSITNPRPKLEKLGGEGFVPIILVPSASQTLITIYNVKEFLEDGVFVTSEEKTKAMRGAAKPEVVTVQKKLIRGERNGPGAGGGAVVACEVRDKPTGLKPEDWGRVVAAFVLGKEWQFKDWPFKDHVEIFNKIIGFYVRFEDDSVESAKVVKQWNVKIISISKNKRHQDRAAALEVWERLEEFIRSRSHN